MQEMKNSREVLKKVISSVHCLHYQGLAIRGHMDEGSNILQLLKLGVYTQNINGYHVMF